MILAIVMIMVMMMNIVIMSLMSMDIGHGQDLLFGVAKWVNLPGYCRDCTLAKSICLQLLCYCIVTSTDEITK